jgi:hypothetical protein
MSALEEQILKTVRTLARVNPLTPEVIMNCSNIKLLSAWNQTRTLKGILEAAKAFHAQGQFGKLRSALLIGTTLFDAEFLIHAERAGVLLGNDTSSQKFHRFYADLSVETANVNDRTGKSFAIA